MKEKKNRLLIALICVFVVSLGLTLAVGFSNVEQPKLFIQSMTPLYDEESTVVVNDNDVTFNDKNQEVKYKVLIENPLSYDVKVSDINLTIPTEEFLEYEIENLNVDDVVKANSTKEIVVDFKTVKKDGWGRNFSDELTADISFAKVAKKEDEKPVPEPEVEEATKEDVKEEVKEEKEETKNEVVPEVSEEEEQPIVSAPVATTEEVKETFTLIETFEIEEDEIVFTEIQNVVDKQMIDVWIYSNPIYLGRFEVEVKGGKTKILGLSEALEKHNIEVGDHSLVLQSETGEKIGYVEVKINNNKLEKQNVEIELPKEDVVNKVEDSVKENVDKQQLTEDEKSNNILLVILVIVTGATGVAIGVIVVKNGKTKTIILLLALCPLLTVVDAEEVIDLTFTFNISFESQNVMKPSGCDFDLDDKSISSCEDYWNYNEKIKNIYINNEISDLSNVVYEFDVTENKNGRVKAYLVTNNNDTNYFDLYLMAEGLIYANEDASLYFGEMINLDKIDNFSGIDTSRVTNMLGMFHRTGYNSQNFVADLSKLNTSKVTNMMRMFYNYGYRSNVLDLNLENFDTSNVTNMKSMFEDTGHYTKNLNVDLSSFDTSKVTDMTYMFKNTGYASDEVVLGISNLNTSSVTNMKYMFTGAGHSSLSFNLDVSSFNTSNVTNMYGMFMGTGRSSNVMSLDVSKFDTSEVTTMAYMFYEAGHYNTKFTLDVSGFDFNKVTDITSMFEYTGHESTEFKTSINMTNPNVKYDYIFNNAVVKGDSEIILNYIKSTESLVDSILSRYSYNSNIVKGKLIVDVDKLSTGDEIHISGEKFNVISQTDDTVTMLAKYNLGSDYKQSNVFNGVGFSNNYGWEAYPGPKEINIQDFDGAAKQYLNGYVSYLENEGIKEIISINLVTLNQLKNLGCTNIKSDYTHSGNETCSSSEYFEWINNGQNMWTSSAYPDKENTVWNIVFVDKTDRFGQSTNRSLSGIRPVVTISKEVLKNYLKS